MVSHKADVGTATSVPGAHITCGDAALGYAEVAHNGRSGGGGSAAAVQVAAEKRVWEVEGGGVVLSMDSAPEEKGQRRFLNMWIEALEDFYGDWPGQRRFRPGEDRTGGESNRDAGGDSGEGSHRANQRGRGCDWRIASDGEGILARPKLEEEREGEREGNIIWRRGTSLSGHRPMRWWSTCHPHTGQCAFVWEPRAAQAGVRDR